MKELSLEVLSINEETAGIFRLDLACPNQTIKGGQFVNIEVPDASLILRRPFCVYEYKNDILTIVFAVIGKGTVALSQVVKGQKLKAVLPLGNGFDISGFKRVGLLGGGMGVAALQMLASQNSDKEISAYLGFSDISRVLFVEDFQKSCKKVAVFTSNGTYGTKGYPMDELLKDIHNLDAVVICGPLGLVKAAQTIPQLQNIPVFVSMEQRMACGVGACLVCTCGMQDGTNRRVCTDGPVFKLDDVKL